MVSPALPVQRLGDLVVAVLPDEIDIANAAAVEDQLVKLLDVATGGLLVDMTNTTFCGAAGAGVLARIYYRAVTAGVRVEFVIPHPIVRKVLNITKLTQVISVHQRLEQAGQATSTPG